MGLVCDHAGKAASAASTALMPSSGVPAAAVQQTSLVYGLTTLKVSLLVSSFPLIQSGTFNLAHLVVPLDPLTFSDIGDIVTIDD